MTRMTWSNWAGNQRCTPTTIARPTTAAEVSRVVTDAAAAGLHVKAVGSGHSFTPVATTDGVLVDLSAMTGLAGVDAASGRVRFRAGTTLREANRLLALQGLAFANLGDIDYQSVAGATSTGTHGTGTAFPGLAATITALQIVLADGRIVDCSATQHPELFQAARLSVGLLGIITEVEMACVPAFRIHAREAPDRLANVLASIDEQRASGDHVEFFWFPHTDRALTKHNTRLALDDPRDEPLAPWRRRLDDELLSNTLFEGINRIAARHPRVTPALNELSGRALSARSYTAASHEVFVTERRVRFRESEYAVPVAALPQVIAGLRAWFERRTAYVSFPVEVRFAAADDVWLSTGYERENAYIAVHVYAGAQAPGYLEAFEDIVADHEGRPHWGKLHRLGAADLARLYPRFEDVLRVRDDVDPLRVFANAHTRHLFGD